MGFGTPITEKKKRKAEVRNITGGNVQAPRLGGLVRIVLLALLAIAAAAYGMYLYYTHAFTAQKPRPAPSAAPSSSEVWIDVQ
ncbi:MAG TPA: hypothetical protein VGH28_32525 [Polyangiaceae bacterium]|jgi:hypothetical protein